MTTFSDVGVAADLSRQLQVIGITTPTPIQAQAIPIALTGRDLIGIAQTGTGKTLAFGLPMIGRLSRTKTQGLVLVPTRELADQVEASLAAVGRPFGLRTALLIGGASMGKQKQQLQRRPHIIIATPGRLIDHLTEHDLVLDQVGILVLDEADRMLDMGFAPQVNQILAVLPKQRQTLLFSATMPATIAELAARSLNNPATVSVAPAGTSAANIEQSLVVIEKGAKTAFLLGVLRETSGSTLVFTRTKYGAKKLCRSLVQAGVSAAEIHGNRSLPQRREALAGFKRGTYRVLVATDIAARGIDVVGIDLVVNYDLPEQPEDYVHRIGRTARAGRAGSAIALAEPDQGGDVRTIERLMGISIPRSAKSTGTFHKTASRDRAGRRRARFDQGVRDPRQRHQHSTGQRRGSIHRHESSQQRGLARSDTSSNQPATHESWTVEQRVRPIAVPQPINAPIVRSDPTTPFII